MSRKVKIRGLEYPIVYNIFSWMKWENEQPQQPRTTRKI